MDKAIDHIEPERRGGAAKPSRWSALAGQTPGRSHLRTGTPCQDAAAAGASPRPHIIVCDGRGSARLSDQGARKAVQSLSSLLYGAKPLFEAVLDNPDGVLAETILPFLAQTICLTAARGQLELVEQTPGAKTADFEHTLVFIAAGDRRFICVQVGDSAAVMRRHGRIETISEQMRGEFANTTFFVSASQGGTMFRKVFGRMEGVDAFAACTDGAAERLIRNSDNSPAPAFGQFWDGMADGSFNREALFRFLSEPEWEPRVQDDRSIALIHRQTPASVMEDEPETPPEYEELTLAEPTPNRNIRVRNKKRHRHVLPILIGCLAAGAAVAAILTGYLLAESISNCLDNIIFQAEPSGVTARIPPAPAEPSPEKTPSDVLNHFEARESRNSDNATNGKDIENEFSKDES